MGRSDWYKSGDWNAECDVCGQKYKMSKLRKRWDGLMVCPKDWEIRHPQDFVKGVRDNQSVPVSRPEVPDGFVEIDYTLFPQLQDPTNDRATIAESFRSVAVFNRNVSDSTGTTVDVLFTQASFVRSLSDSLSGSTDVLSHVVSFNRNLTDSSAISDTTISFTIVSGSPINGSAINTLSLNG